MEIIRDHGPIGACAGHFPDLPATVGPSYLLLCVERSDQKKRAPDPLGLAWFECICGEKVQRLPADVISNRVRFCGDGCRMRPAVVGSEP